MAEIRFRKGITGFLVQVCPKLFSEVNWIVEIYMGCEEADGWVSQSPNSAVAQQHVTYDSGWRGLAGCDPDCGYET